MRAMIHTGPKRHVFTPSIGLRYVCYWSSVRPGPGFLTLCGPGGTHPKALGRATGGRSTITLWIHEAGTMAGKGQTPPSFVSRSLLDRTSHPAYVSGAISAQEPACDVPASLSACSHRSHEHTAVKTPEPPNRTDFEQWQHQVAGEDYGRRSDLLHLPRWNKEDVCVLVHVGGRRSHCLPPWHLQELQ